MMHATDGSERTMVLMARIATGTPLAFQWLRTFGVKIDRVRIEGLRGEVQIPRHAERGPILSSPGVGSSAGAPAPYRPLTLGLARLARRRVFSLDYRRAPEHRFPAALDDAVLAYRWLLDHGVAPR